jgi:hypothetical protein
MNNNSLTMDKIAGNVLLNRIIFESYRYWNDLHYFILVKEIKRIIQIRNKSDSQDALRGYVA